MTVSRRRSSACGTTGSTRFAPTSASGFAARPKIRFPGRLSASSWPSGFRGAIRPTPQAAPIRYRWRAASILRGSIDLVERGLGGRLRVTDHKTGKADAPKDVIIGGGRVLQPVLYALAAERLLGEPVESGRLYYCTSRGGYEERVVALDDAARAAAREFAAAVSGALADGFLPAAPAEGGCRWCDYRLVCGPYEEMRVAQKPPARLAALERLRELR